MCLALAPRDPSRTFEQFLADLSVPVRIFSVAPRLDGPLPCGCKPSKAAKKSGRRGLSVTKTTVVHTRCRATLARHNGQQFEVITSTVMEESTFEMT